MRAGDFSLFVLLLSTDSCGLFKIRSTHKADCGLLLLLACAVFTTSKPLKPFSPRRGLLMACPYHYVSPLSGYAFPCHPLVTNWKSKIQSKQVSHATQQSGKDTDLKRVCHSYPHSGARYSINATAHTLSLFLRATCVPVPPPLCQGATLRAGTLGPTPSSTESTPRVPRPGREPRCTSRARATCTSSSTGASGTWELP